MRTLYQFLTISLDGYFEGPDHDLSWHHVDDEFNEFAIEQLRRTDLYLWGRRTYELMRSYWPLVPDEPDVSAADLEVARLFNTTPKIVYSKTLERVEESGRWQNVRLERDLDPSMIRAIKEAPGEQIGVGASALATAFTKAGLIDEYRFVISPTLLGKGTPLLSGLDAPLPLDLISVREFRSGNVLLTYRPRGG